MFSGIVKILLTLSALAPICLIYAWVAASEEYTWLAFWLLIAVFVLVPACLATLWMASHRLETIPIKFASAEPADQENISLLLLYISPVFVDSIDKVNLNILLPSLGLYALLLATSYTYHFNPLLSLMQWHFYKVQTTDGISYVLLTRNKITNLDNPFIVGQLTGYMLIEHSEF